MSTAELRALLRDAFRDAVRSIDLARLVHDALDRDPPVDGPVALVAIGKAGPAMAAGALARWGDRIGDALVVTTDGTDASTLPSRVELRRAGHPVFDDRSLAAADRALAVAKRGGAMLLALVSGGASALVEAPPAGLAPDELRVVAADLVASALPIDRINTVRRHLSRIKGGRLALAARPALVLTLYASDVPNGAAHDVGSGPTVPDPTSVDDALAALGDAFGAPRATALAPFLSPSLDPTSADARRTEAHAVATPTTLADALAARLRSAGLAVTVAPERAPRADELVVEYAARARALPRGHAVVLPCEPTLHVAAPGRGGRSGWLALALLPHLPADVAFLAGASDGVDGTSGTAGACVAGDLPFDAAVASGALAAFDDARVHASLGSALAGGPTGVNLTDVHVLARAR